jgi:hypothetical protein
MHAVEKAEVSRYCRDEHVRLVHTFVLDALIAPRLWTTVTVMFESVFIVGYWRTNHRSDLAR